MPGQYTFKTAPLGKRLSLEVGPRTLTVRKVGGTREETVDLTQVTRARVASMTASYTTSRWFDLWHPAGRTRIGCNGAGQDEHSAQYEAAVDDTLRVLAEVAPDARIAGGLGGGTKWTFFVMGVLALLVGIGLPVAGWLTGAGRDKLLAGLAPSLVMILLGVVFVRWNRPWVPERTFPARAYVTAQGAGDEGR